MSSNRSKAGSSGSNSVDVSQHPGFVNLGNTCFLNSALQAISATQSLKHLYQPTEDELQQQQEHVLQKFHLQAAQASLSPIEVSPAPTPGPSSRRESVVSELINARCKSPVLRLADEEHGRLWGQAISRPGSTSIEASSIRALASQAVCNPTPADIQSIHQSRRNSIENEKQKYEPQSKDIPLNTAFRQVMEKSWDPANRRNSKTPIKPSKVASINPKSLLNEISTKYDQYGEYRQQDGHELLRHLLDSLRMEELDVIKKIQPPESNEKRRKSTGSQSQASQSPYITQNGGSVDERDDNLKPLVDNLFCGKLLSFVVCEGCRHVSHTYEDFYDISLSLRPEVDAKENGKRQRIRSMADRWRRSASGKATGGSKEEVSKPLADSLAMLLDGQSGSYSDTEQSDDPVKRSNSRIGRGISRPRSTADRARIDANSKEGAKTFIKKQMEDHHVEQSDAEVGPEKAMEKLSIDAPIEKKRESGVSLLRAVSGRRTPASRAASPLRRDTVDSDPKRSSSPGVRSGDAENDSESSAHHRHHLHFGGHKKKVVSKHAKYLSSLLTEAAPQPQQANLGALFWGRSRTPGVNDVSSDQKGANSEDLIAQQAGTGLIKALHQFTSVEVLDGSNSFACKRCWRLLNPPSAEEDQKLRLRRLRRGKGEHDSEESSDDDSSSDEEAKEEKQKAAIKSSIKSSTNGSSASSLASVSDIPFTESSVERSVESLVQGDNEICESPSAMQTVNGSTPSVVISSTEAQTGSETPTRSTTMIAPLPQPKREATLKASQLNATSDLSETPKLQAPKPIMASLRLGKALSSTSSDEGGGSNQPSSDESSDEESNAQTPSEAGSRKRSIKYADEGMSSITKPAPIATTKQPAIRRKRSIHSLQRRALKRFLIAETPKVFVFHFKRFQATGRGFSFSTSFKKIDDYVSFPEYLDVKPWLAPPREEYDRHGKLKASSDPRALLKAQQEAESQGSQKHHHHHWGWRPHHHHQENKAEILAYQPKTKYRLYAVVVHQGSMSGGHYTAYVLSDRANESLKAKADAHANATETAKSSSTKEKATKKTNGASSGASANGEGSVTAASTPSPLTTNGNAAGSNTRIDSLSSVSSLDSDIGQQEGEKEASSTTQNEKPIPSTVTKTDERRWIFASDTQVRPANIEEVLKAQAYMLFYEQL
ncbi:cysteine proteinase [Meira miltonrushii]|uniref:ubiquitinyl hydrolase 1 n=1 Tax=Meira miltonrushii TaxID=1280837 RepID=A0A316V9L2_9BASI|nr:cysteine proteinase [Meira miltonrushii]PWN32175.1 cysteine proteinase [Meira miltonrushii]